MADTGTIFVGICTAIVGFGMAYITVINYRYGIRQKAFDALQASYDAVVDENRQLKEERIELQAALVRRVVQSTRPGRPSHGAGE